MLRQFRAMANMVSTFLSTCQCRQSNLLLVMSALVTLVLGGPALAADDQSIDVSFSGTAGKRFHADCILTSDEGTESITFADQVPRHYSLVGRGLDCRITREAGRGNVMVEIDKGGQSISRASVAGGTGMTRIQVR